MKDINKTTESQSTYTPAIGEAICERIATTTKSLKTICAGNKKFPHPCTFYRWMKENPELLQCYLLAEKQRADLLANETVQIADDCFDKIKNAEAARVNAIVNCARMQIGVRRWYAGTLHPKKYRPNFDVTSAGDKIEGGIINISNPNKTD